MYVTPSVPSLSRAAVWLAVVGGFLWSFGPVGAKTGVYNSSRVHLNARSALTAIFLALGNGFASTVTFCTLDADIRRRVMYNEAWLRSLPLLEAGAVLAAIGGLLGILALSRASKNSSCIVAAVETGVYSVASSLLIVLMLKETPSTEGYIAGGLIIVGIVSMQLQGVEVMKDSKTMNEMDYDEQVSLLPPYGLATGKRHSYVDHRDDHVACLLAVAAGVFWSCGIVGKRNSAKSLPYGLEKQGAAATYMVYSCGGFATRLVYFFALVCCTKIDWSDTCDWLQTRALKVFGAGLIAGTGGCITTYALSLATSNSAVIALVIDGVVTISASMLLAILHHERLAINQLIGFGFILMAIILVDAHQLSRSLH